MKLLDDAQLERSPVVANSRMNRERVATGTNGYTKEIGLNPLAYLQHRLDEARSAAWLDLCCGRGRALIEAAEFIGSPGPGHHVSLHGVDLVDFFDDVPLGLSHLKLQSASLHRWKPDRTFDLITCVHGLHYVGDTVSLIERAAAWLRSEGMLVANLDLANLRSADGRPLGRLVVQKLRDNGIEYDSRRRVLSCVGGRSISLGFRYLGANDQAGPNYTGQEAVDSYYEPLNAQDPVR